MLTRLIALSVLLIGNLPLVTGQGEIRFNRKETDEGISRVFVIASDSKPCEGTDLSSESIAEYAEVALLSQYEILERKHLEMLLQEQRLGMSGLIFEDQAVEAGCLQGSQGIVFCSVGCLSGQTMTKIKLVDCRESLQHWSAVGIDVAPSLIVAEALENLQSGRLSNVVLLAGATKTNSTEVQFNCGQEYDYHGHAYATVEIGGRCWFAENLQTTTYRNGDAIPQNLSEADWSETTSGAMAFHVDVPTYGGLYNWHAVDDARGLCPSDWHIPTDREWTAMTDVLGGSSIAGDQMKTDYAWFSGGNGSNSSGFSGLPGGVRNHYGDFYSATIFQENAGYWWSSSPSGSNAWYRALYSSNEDVYRETYGGPQCGFSVRCVRDAE